MKIAVAFPTVVRADLLKEAIAPIQRHRDLFSSIIVIDNGFQDLKWLPSNVILIRNVRNLGFAGSCNEAMAMTLEPRGFDDWLLIHSDDVVLSDESVAAVPDVCRDHATRWLVRSSASWSVVLINRQCLNVMRYAQNEYLDDEFWPGQFEDLDFEWRMELEAGPSVIVSDEERLYPVVYRRKGSRAVPEFRKRRRENRARFIAKWGSLRRDRRYTVPFDGERKWPSDQTT